MNKENEYKSKIYYVRGQSVMLDRDLAEFYGTNTKIFNQAMRRKIKEFDSKVFQLTQEEYQEILSLTKDVRTSKTLPFVYTEKAAYRMAFVLSNKTSLKVADLILDVFISVREGKYLPLQKDNKMALLEMRVQQLELQMQGKQILNNFHAPVTLIQGNKNTVTIGSKEDVILKIIEVMNNKEVVGNQDLVKLLSESITHANNKDKTSLLKSLKTVVDIGTGVTGIVQNIPQLIDVICKLF